MQVMKFGGTSVNDAKMIAQVAAIAAEQLKTDPNVVVVTSAMRGVTDLLINSAKAAASGDRQAYRDARATLVTRHRDAAEALIPDLDALPLPAWDLAPMAFYQRERSMAHVGQRAYLPLVTSRGCPYQCIYCHQIHGKRFRSRSPENVLAEARGKQPEPFIPNMHGEFVSVGPTWGAGWMLGGMKS